MDLVRRYQPSSGFDVDSLWGKKKRRGRRAKLGLDGKPIGKGRTAGTTLTPELTALLGEAETFYVDGNYPEAIRVLSEITKLAPKLSYIYSMLALIYEETGMPQYSLHLYALAASYEKDLDLWSKVVHLGLEFGEYDQVMRALSRCSRITVRRQKKEKAKKMKMMKKKPSKRQRNAEEEVEEEEEEGGEEEEKNDSEDEEEKERTAARDKELSLTAKELQALLLRNKSSSSVPSPGTGSFEKESSTYDFHRFSRLRLILLIKMGRFTQYRPAIQYHHTNFPLDTHIFCEVAQCFYEEGYDRHAVDYFQKYLESYLLQLIQHNQLVISMQSTLSATTRRTSSALSLSHLLTPQALDSTRDAQKRLSENLSEVFFASRQLSLLLLESFNDCQEVVELIENLFAIFHQMKDSEPRIEKVQDCEFPLDLLLFLGLNKLKSARKEEEVNDAMQIMQPALVSIMQTPQQFFSLLSESSSSSCAQVMDVQDDEEDVEEDEEQEELPIDARTLEDQLFLLFELVLIGECFAEQGMKTKGQRLIHFALGKFRGLMERDTLRSLFIHMLSPHAVFENANLCDQVSYRLVFTVFEKLVDVFVSSSAGGKSAALEKEGKLLLSLLEEAMDVYPFDSLLMRDLSVVTNIVCDAADEQRKTLLQKMKLYTCLLRNVLHETFALTDTEEKRAKEEKRNQNALKRRENAAQLAKEKESAKVEADMDVAEEEEDDADDADKERDEDAEEEEDDDAANKIIEEIDDFLEITALEESSQPRAASSSSSSQNAQGTIGAAHDASLLVEEGEEEVDEDDEEDEDEVGNVNLDRVLHPNEDANPAYIDEVSPLALLGQAVEESEQEKDNAVLLADKLRQAVFVPLRGKALVHRRVLRGIVLALLQYTLSLQRVISLSTAGGEGGSAATRSNTDEISTFLSLTTAWFDCFSRSSTLNLKYRERVEVDLLSKHSHTNFLRISGKDVVSRGHETLNKRHQQNLTQVAEENDEKFSWMRDSDKDLFSILLTLCEYVPVEDFVTRDVLSSLGKSAREIFTRHSLFAAAKQIMQREEEAEIHFRAAVERYFAHSSTPQVQPKNKSASLLSTSSSNVAEKPLVNEQALPASAVVAGRVNTRRLRILFSKQKRVIRNAEQLGFQCREIAESITNLYNDLCRVKESTASEAAPSSALLSSTSSQAIAVQLESELVHYCNLFGQLLHQQYLAEVEKDEEDGDGDTTNVLRKADSRFLENRLPISSMFDEGKLRQLKTLTTELLFGHEQAVFKRHSDVLDHYFNAFIIDPQQPLTALCIAAYLVMLANHHLTKYRLDAVSKGYAFFLYYKHIRCSKATPALLPHERDSQYTLLSEPAKLQETLYNFGRAFQELNLPQLAMEQYEQALRLAEEHPEELSASRHGEKKLNVTRQSAVNLILIYKQSKAPQLALDVMMKHLMFE